MRVCLHRPPLILPSQWPAGNASLWCAHSLMQIDLVNCVQICTGRPVCWIAVRTRAMPGCPGWRRPAGGRAASTMRPRLAVAYRSRGQVSAGPAAHASGCSMHMRIPAPGGASLWVLGSVSLQCRFFGQCPGARGRKQTDTKKRPSSPVPADWRTGILRPNPLRPFQIQTASDVAQWRCHFGTGTATALSEGALELAEGGRAFLHPSRTGI